MDVLFLIGRIMYVLVFLVSAVVFPLTSTGRSPVRRRYSLAPAPERTIPVLGALAVIGALMVAFGVLADLGVLFLIIFLVPMAVFMHPFWTQRGGEAKRVEFGHFLEYVALIGGAIILFYAYNQLQGNAGLSLTDPLFN